jgi:hypothetical protein
MRPWGAPTPLYPNWQRNRIQSPGVQGSTPWGGTTLTACATYPRAMPTNVPADYVEPDLCVDPTDVARKVGLDFDSLTDDQQWLIGDAIRDAQSDVEAYLGRAIMPTEYRAEGAVQNPITGKWDLPEQPVITVDTVTAETDTEGRPTGRYTVDYTAGLNARTNQALRPIRRYVAAAACLDPTVTRLSDKMRPVTGVNVDGQGITFGTGGQATKTGVAKPGDLPDMSSMDRWRVKGRRVFQRQGDHPPIVEPTAWRG